MPTLLQIHHEFCDLFGPSLNALLASRPGQAYGAIRDVLVTEESEQLRRLSALAERDPVKGIKEAIEFTKTSHNCEAIDQIVLIHAGMIPDGDQETAIVAAGAIASTYFNEMSDHPGYDFSRLQALAQLFTRLSRSSSDLNKEVQELADWLFGVLYDVLTCNEVPVINWKDYVTQANILLPFVSYEIQVRIGGYDMDESPELGL